MSDCICAQLLSILNPSLHWMRKISQIEVIAAVEVAIGDGFVDVVLLDGGGGFEVGDGAGHLEDAVVGAGTHVEALHGVAQLLKAGGVGLGPLVEQRRGHLGVAVHTAHVLETLRLYLAGGHHTGTDGTRRLAGGLR